MKYEESAKINIYIPSIPQHLYIQVAWYLQTTGIQGYVYVLLRISYSRPSGLSRQLRTDESPMMVKSQWRDENSRFFELRLKEGIQLHPTPTKRKMSSLDVGDFEAQIRSLTEEKNQLLGELSVFHSELIEKGKVEQQLELVSEECATVKARYKSEQLSHNRVLSEMKGRLQQLSFEKTKVEDQITIMSAASGGGKVSSDVLMEIQSKYSKTVDSLKMQLTERGRDNEELMRKNITLVSSLYPP